MRTAIGLFCVAAAVALLILSGVVAFQRDERRFGQVGTALILLAGGVVLALAGLELLR